MTSLNRTSVGLKLQAATGNALNSKCLNRTSVGLKPCDSSSDCGSSLGASIEPAWD